MKLDADTVLPYPIARVGIVGGGQLGRLLVKAAKKLGCSAWVLDPTPDAPAAQIAGHQIVGDFRDPAKLAELAAAVEVLTFDIEHVNTEALTRLERQGHRIRPAPAVLAVIQDKLLQKQVLANAGIPVAPFRGLDAPSAEALAAFGYPLVQKAREGGYDGRGVAILHGPADAARALPMPSVLERLVGIERELAIMVARGLDGETVAYPVAEMQFRPEAPILDLLLVPARISPDWTRAAQELAVRTVAALGGVGIFGVELFLDRNGALLVNEVAPRPHNSGHYTLEACVTDQFEQHLRAIIGLPLGSTELLRPAAMVNLLGEPPRSGPALIHGLPAALAIPGVSVHLYGKERCAPLRKMGHATVLDADLALAQAKAERVRSLLHITGAEE